MRQTTSEWRTMHRQTGFTLVEMIVAITLLAILAMVAVPMFQLPMRAYLDAAVRADVNAQMDLAASKIRDDFTQAVPGSVRVRVVGASTYIEFLRYRAMGRYRLAGAAVAVCPAACIGPNPQHMQFATPTENCFETIGPLSPSGATLVANSDFIAMPRSGNVYLGGNGNGPAKASFQQIVPSNPPPANTPACLRMLANNFTTPAAQVALEQIRRNFYVVETPVVYECNTTTGQLLRRWGHPITAANIPVAYGAAPSALLATNVFACTFRVLPNTPFAGTRQLALMQVRFRVTPAGTGSPEFAEANWQFSVQETP